MVAAACGSGERADAPPTGPTPPPPDTTGTVQRGTLTVNVILDQDDASIGDALGISERNPSGMVVTLTALAGTATPTRTDTTNASGRVIFDRLLEGAYSIGAERLLTAAERSSLPSTDVDIVGFAGGTTLSVGIGAQTTTVSVSAGRPGSLVISEIWPYRAPIGEDLAYSYSRYLELYNNGDTAVYLDGVLFGSVPPVSWNGRVDGELTFDFCTIFREVRSDATQLPLTSTQLFPGSGRDFPVAPGEAVVIAVDAIDHRPFGEGTLDLSDADFESYGDSRDIDNPAVPDVTGVPGTVFRGPEGRGYDFGSFLPDAYVLAKPSTTTFERLTVDDRFTFGRDLVVVSATDILDVAFIDWTPDVVALLAANGAVRESCPVPWSSRWDRAPARISDPNVQRGNRAAFVRRTAYTRPDGRVVLQRTKTSARDWVYGPPPTPGFVRP